jgi:ATP-dependent DNA ligase
VIERGKTRAYTRNGYDWSDHCPLIIEAAARLPCRAAIVDGEVIVQDEHGASDFEALQLALRFWPGRLIFYAFDLLHLDGKDLRQRPLLERRGKLKALLAGDPASPLQYSEEFVGDAEAFFNACAKHALEGIISKRASSPYRSGRTKTWLKTKCFTESKLILLGVDRDRKTGAARALLAKPEQSGLMYAGAAFIALAGDARDQLNSKLEALAQERPSLSWLRNKQARWVRPELALRVRHLAGARLLRHATVREIFDL